jgi:hypothetical protein
MGCAVIPTVRTEHGPHILHVACVQQSQAGQMKTYPAKGMVIGPADDKKMQLEVYAAVLTTDGTVDFFGMYDRRCCFCGLLS